MVQYLHMARLDQAKPTLSWVRKAATTRLTSAGCCRVCFSTYSIRSMHKLELLLMEVRSATAAIALAWVCEVPISFPLSPNVREHGICGSYCDFLFSCQREHLHENFCINHITEIYNEKIYDLSAVSNGKPHTGLQV